jgi:hypothetical protein
MKAFKQNLDKYLAPPRRQEQAVELTFVDGIHKLVHIHGVCLSANGDQLLRSQHIHTEQSPSMFNLNSAVLLINL